MTGMVWVLLVAACAVIGALIYAERAWFGPLTPGSVRWRRELPAMRARWAAQNAHNEAISALTDEDRAWLTERGWAGGT